MTDQTAATPEWHDGDPLMEAIAAAVWEHCHTAGTCVSDDPRNIAAAAAAGIRDAARQATGQPDTEQPVVAYRDPNNPRVLLCRQHGQSWHAITPATAEDLPDGGICTFGRLSSNECGRDVLATSTPAVGQPAAPADLTPHEARQRAEQQLDGALRIVIDYVIESNDVGGLDCNDLADRLRSAGYELPDDEDES